MLSKVPLYVSLASVIIGGESIKINQIPFTQPAAHGNDLIRTLAAAPPNIGQPISQDERDTWNLNCTSVLLTHKCGRTRDGSNDTFWQTKVDSQTVDPLPHNITIDLRDIKHVNAISVRPLPDADLGGAIAGHEVYTSIDNVNWTLVAFGTWFEDLQDKFAIFEPQKAKFVRLRATSATNGTQYIRVVDLNVWITPEPTTPQSPSLGKWGPTVDFPLVPVGVFIDPIGGKVISFSSYAHDGFGQGVTDHTTLTATWDPTTTKMSHRQVRKTNHDMFCPGMSFDVHGRMIISGGESADKVSIYNASADDWTSTAEMKIPRGYQGSVTCANGHIFVIGGSWGPVGIDFGDRYGETYDPETEKWTRLSECRSENISTTMDWEGDYRADNHVWLMGWKNNSVFQAGPSRQMHWITLTGSGAIVNASRRGDNDSMCGVAAMYDAVEGKILAAGGAPSYNYKDGNMKPRSGKATAEAFVITLDQVNASVSVTPTSQKMHHPRSFTHAVILPNGETLIVGGQEEPRVFTEETAVFEPEIYSPRTDTWTPVANNSIPRVYHSFALLLRDGTVLVGGGGLNSMKAVNHFDAQIYYPQYLLLADGSSAPRPAITGTSDAAVYPGGNLTITTDMEVVSASLVRYGGATHSLNNDQRRIPLDLQASGIPLEYGVSIPADGGVAIPGYYMLFVMNSKGVPSKAENVQVLVAKEH